MTTESEVTLPDALAWLKSLSGDYAAKIAEHINTLQTKLNLGASEILIGESNFFNELADGGIADPHGDEEMISACVFASGVLRKRADEIKSNKAGAQ